MIRDVYSLVKGELLVAYINVDSLTVEVNWDYDGKLPEKLFITGNKEELITPEKIINYLKYKTRTKSFIDSLLALEDMKQDTSDGFKLYPRPVTVYGESKLKSLQEKEIRKELRNKENNKASGEEVESSDLPLP